MASLSLTPAFGSPSGSQTGLLNRILRRRWLFLAVVAATLLIVALGLFSILPRYVASGSVIVAEAEGGGPRISDAWIQKIGDPADLESQLVLIRSPRLARLALARPGVLAAIHRECDRAEGASWFSRQLSGTPALSCDSLKPDSDALLNWAAARFQVSPVGQSRAISIGYQSELPETARDLANALVQAFLDDPRVAPAQQGDREVARRWQDVAQLEASLRDQDAKIVSLKRDASDRAQLASTNAERQATLARQIAAPQQAMAEAVVRMRNSQRGMGGQPEMRSAMDARTIADAHQQLDAVTAQLAAEPAGSADLAGLREQRDALKLRVDREGLPAFRAANRKYQTAAAQAVTLQRQLDIIKQEPAAPATADTDIAALERNAEVKRTLYTEQYKRASETEAERPVLVNTARLVNLAERPSEPVFPRPLPTGGLLLALGLGTLVARLRDGADRTVRVAGDVEMRSQVPVLAQIPRVLPPGAGLVARVSGRGSAMGLNETLGAAQRSPTVQDALRGLHARLVLAGHVGDRRRTILVTSAAPGEGKTFTTLALAQLIAAGGRRVLAIECDLRRPTFANALNLSSGPGLGDVLRGFVSPREAVTRTALLTLDAIPAGPPCAESTELLMGGRMAELLAWADMYDVVLLDSPPSDVLMDARVLAKLVDGVLVVTRWGGSKLTELGDAVDGMRSAGGFVYGVAVTMVETREHGLFDQRPVPAIAYMGQQ